MNLIDCRIEEIITVEYMYHEKLGKKICVRFKYSDMGSGGITHKLFDIGVDWKKYIYIGKIIQM